MNYTYSDLWKMREKYKVLHRLVYTCGFFNGEAINKLLETKRDIKRIKQELREPI